MTVEDFYQETGRSVVSTAEDESATGAGEVFCWPDHPCGLPKSYDKASIAADIVIHPTGQHAYASNLGHDSIASYQIEEESGRFELLGHQSYGDKVPRNMTLDSSGNFLLVANQDSDTISVFTFDAETGSLEHFHQCHAPMPTNPITV